MSLWSLSVKPKWLKGQYSPANCYASSQGWMYYWSTSWREVLVAIGNLSTRMGTGSISRIFFASTSVTAGSSQNIDVDFNKQVDVTGNPTITLTRTAVRTIDTISRLTNVVTVTTLTNHGFTSADSVVISGTTSTTNSFNGTFTITVTGAKTFTYSQTGADESGTTSASSLATFTDTATATYASQNAPKVECVFAYTAPSGYIPYTLTVAAQTIALAGGHIYETGTTTEIGRDISADQASGMGTITVSA